MFIFFFVVMHFGILINMQRKKKYKELKTNIEENKKIYQWGEHGECPENNQRLVEED
jgi:preprotein translocase subunit YajC